MEIDISSFFNVNKIMFYSVLISILIFLISLHLLRNTYIRKEYFYTFKNAKGEKIPLKLWEIILIFIGSFIPVIRIILFFAIFIYIYLYNKDKVYYKMPNKSIFRLLRRIGRFLNKDV